MTSFGHFTILPHVFAILDRGMKKVELKVLSVMPGAIIWFLFQRLRI